MLRVGSLFAGIGGIDLGFEWAGMKTVWQVEKDKFCRKVLAKHWPDVPRYEDVNEIDWSTVAPVDVIAGGYPCQPFSLAGKRKGAGDNRHLWPRMFEAIKELRPTWVLGENVAGHVSMGLDCVLADLEAQGYSCRPFIIPACAVGAMHQRDRVWIVAHNDEDREPLGSLNAKVEEAPSSTHTNQTRRAAWGNAGEDTADVGGFQPGGGPAKHLAGSRGWRWGHKPLLGRGVHGIPNRLDRVGALGNAVVPQVAYEIGRAIVAAHLAGEA